MNNKIAAIQMCSSTDVEENLKTAAKLIEDAATQGARVVVLPEMFAIIGDNASKVKAMEHFGDNGVMQKFLSNQALLHKIWIIGGTIPLISETNLHKIRAACLVYDACGHLVARYDKMHLFDVVLSEHEAYIESQSTDAGDKVVVIDTPVGRVGIAVCFDIRFPDFCRCLANNGAEIIVVPAAFTQTTGEAHWELLLRGRAIDNLCYVVGAAQGGVHANGRHTFGNSMVVDPWGKVIAVAEIAQEPTIVCANIDLEYVKMVRKKLPLL
jgi:deaminated glutathione amidase